MLLVIQILFFVFISQSLKFKSHTLISSNTLSSQNSLLSSIDSLLKDIKQPLFEDQNRTQYILNLQDKVLAVRAKFADLSQYTLFALNKTQWVCATNPNVLNIENIGSNLTASVKQVSAALSKKNSSLNKTGDILSLLTSSLKSQAESKGTTVDSPLPKRFNLYADNWISTPKGMQQMQSMFTAGALYQDCPKETPFVNDRGDCFSCNNQYYSFIAKQCVDCNDFDQNSYTCPSFSQNITNWKQIQNRAILALGQSRPKEEATNKVCPKETPLFDGMSCIVCPNLYNLTSLTCSDCPPQRIYDSYFSSCVRREQTLLTGALLPSDTNVSQWKSTPSQKGSGCQGDGEFFNGSSCLKCQGGTYFSVVSLTCVTCPQEYIYDSTTLHCVAIAYYSNLDNDMWLSNSSSPAKVQSTTAALGGKVYAVRCSIATPFYNGKTCLSCTLPTFFSFDTLQCVSCPPALQFSRNLHTCLGESKKLTNPNTAPNLILNGHSLNEWSSKYFNDINNNSKLSACETAKPYSDGVTCINCPTDKPYFNLQSLLCQSCVTNTFYDQQMRECVSHTGNIATQSPTLQKIAIGIFT